MNGAAGRDGDGPSGGHGEIVLREMLPGDIDAIAALEKTLFTDPWSRRSFHAVLDDPYVRAIVAVEGADVVGYAVARYVGDEGELANIAVRPHRQRSGIGARLLAAVLDQAWSVGVHRIFLEVRESNAAARALYAAFGFSHLARRRAYYTKPVEDALVLMLER